MITRKIRKAIKEKTNFDADGYTGEWFKGVDGWAYHVFYGNFPSYQCGGSYYISGGGHYVKEHCPDELKSVLIDAWATLPAFTKTFDSMMN
tara:strand:+ start:500 stop:772 length:273 start_codon:yes stop_codon:yes gene_type:complete